MIIGMNFAIHNPVYYFWNTSPHNLSFLFFDRYHNKLKRMQFFCQAQSVDGGVNGEYILQNPES